MSTRISLYDLESMYDKKMMMTKNKAGRREGGKAANGEWWWWYGQWPLVVAIRWRGYVRT
jgi:hypothetical protein